ncbi:zinc-binding dehydrogenase [Nocardioides sp. YIM 152315]|uniref:zinc-binding dehydrogenase n=1 Tax=Nocardioides sp. YIM 152315 TaxID=3031760 RepID=UPI0023DB9813|nr:zinc-binding dehydrogenase [Nocardioides sp. YIM 152315]MDF1605412.1 zinc-binding dehydrogenase [Nocardioides sp. YIM 152315]
MRIAVLRGPERFEVDDVPVPRIRPDEVLVRVAASGVCASELEPWVDGPSTGEPRYPGHEVSGVVVETGAEVTDLDVGVRVGVWVTERGFAEYVAVRAAYCFPAGDGSLDEALAEPLSCVVNAVELADPRLGDDVVVIGAGFMGNLVQQLVALRGPRQLIVADTRPEALERASRLGATRVVDVTRESLPDVVRSLTDGGGADLTFECTGTQAALTSCGETTRMSGKVAIVGFHQGPSREIPLAYWNWMAFTILNAHFRDPAVIMRGMEVGMRLVSSGVLSMHGLVTHRFGLEDINEAFATLRGKPEGFVKAVIAFPDE